MVSTGDVVRNMYAGDADSQSLGEFAARMRREQGQAFATLELIGEIIDGVFEPDYPLMIDGVRHREEVRECREFFTTTYVVWVSAGGFDQRLARLQERAREGEESFGVGGLLERDRRELQELGTETLMNGNVRRDYRIVNDGTLDGLREQVEGIVNE
jgi:hypothetical protein